MNKYNFFIKIMISILTINSYCGQQETNLIEPKQRLSIYDAHCLNKISELLRGSYKCETDEKTDEAINNALYCARKGLITTLQAQMALSSVARTIGSRNPKILSSVQELSDINLQNQSDEKERKEIEKENRGNRRELQFAMDL